MNPEFRRQLWLRVSRERMIALPIVVYLLLGLVGSLADWERDALATTSLMLGATISGLVGGAAAIESLLSEIRERTWDWQRLSALDPWSMTWGKLFGSTLYALFGSCLAYAVYLAVGGIESAQTHPVLVVLLALVMGTLVQAAGLLGAAGHLERRATSVQPGTSYVFGAAAAMLMLAVLMSVATRSHAPISSVDWYGIAVPTVTLLLASAYALCCWAVFGTYRLLRAELVSETSPMGSLVFMLFLAVYAAGFVPTLPGGVPIVGTKARLLVGQGVITSMAYFACAHGTTSVDALRRWLASLRGPVRQAWARTPVWAAAIALSTLTGTMTAATMLTDRLPGDVVIGSVIASSVMVVIRDAGLIWVMRMREGALSNDVWILLFLICLHCVVPATLFDSKLDDLRMLLSVHPPSGWLGSAVLMVEAGLAFLLARARLRTYQARL